MKVKKQISLKENLETKKQVQNNLTKKAINDKGITLIALVVTIIVLLILAGVTITAVLGEDGIIERAQEAADKTKNAVDATEKDLSGLSNLIEGILGGGGNTDTPKTDITEPSNKYPDGRVEGENEKSVVETVVVPTKENNKLMVYTVSWISKTSVEKGIQGTTYTINLSNLGIDFTKYSLKVENEAVMTTLDDFTKYLESKNKGNMGLEGDTTGRRAQATAEELYGHSLNGDHLKINNIKVSCEGNTCKITIEESFEKLNELQESSYHTTQTTAGEAITVVYPGIKFELVPTEKTAVATVKEAIDGGKAFAQNENREVTDGEKTMWVPQGYTVLDPTQDSTVQYADNNDPKINEGIVITDAVDGKSGGNEFVWVPVPNPEEMYGIDSSDDTGTRYLGKLYDFGTSSEPKETPAPKNWTNAEDKKISWKTTTGSESYCEPDILTGRNYDAKQENLNIVVEEKYKTSGTATMDGFKTQLQSEFNEMAKSVAKYKGFYIGRYETSKLKTEKPEVKPGDPTVETNWYTMYKNSKKIAQESSGATSSMIWGSQWDATLKWFISCGGTAKTYVTNSSGMGWYSGVSGNSTHRTGEPLTEEIKNRVNNIYDMAGNMYEWTIEACDTYSRVCRGGTCYDYGSSYPASSRSSIILPTNSNCNDLSSRAALYVNM